MLKRDQNLAYILILNLLYPAVLGSIFYSVFSNLGTFRIGVPEITCSLMMISVIVFFAIDFLYTYLHEKYSAFLFLSDCLLLVLMQGAFNSINFLVGNANSRGYCLYLSLTFLVFVVWDFFQREGLGKNFGGIIKLELALILAFTLLALRKNPGYLFPAIVSAIGALSMGKLFLDFYLSRDEGRRKRAADTMLDALPALTLPTKISLFGGLKKNSQNFINGSLGAISALILATLRNINNKVRKT